MLNLFRCVTRACALGLLAVPLLAGAAEPIPVDALTRLPAIQSVSMDPSGKHLVGLVPSPKSPDETALATWDLDSLASGPKVVTPSGEQMKFIAAFALKADKILAIARQEWTGDGGCVEGRSLGTTKTFVTKAYLTGDAQKKFEEAFADDKTAVGVSKQTQRCLELAGTASLVSMLPLDPDNVIIQQVSEVSLSSNYYRYNLKTGEKELLFHGGARAAPSLFDARNGKVLVKSEIEPTGDNDYDQRFLIIDPKSGKFEVQDPLTTKLSDRHSVSVVGVDDATGKYYVLTDQFSDQVQARVYDPSQKKFDPEPLLADNSFSIGGLIFSTRPTNFNKIVGFIVDGPYRQQVFVDPTLKGIQESIGKAFDGQQISISSYTDDFSKVLFSTESASTPPAWHLLLNKAQVVNLGSEFPTVKPGMTGAESWVTYKARDGMEIPAILDLPAGWKKGDAVAPAILMPHGGPWARDYMGWDAPGWVPMLTSRGYAVLRPQYRGSSGLGRKLWLAGDGQWGQTMSDDLDDGAAWLVAQGIAAKDRIAIFGYSYGGFAAVAADVRSPSPFQCAIAGAPVADLGRLGTSWSDNRLQRILQGQTVKGMDPMKNASKAHLPILLFDGDRDVRTPPSIHAEPFYKAVKDIVPAQYHVIADMPHSMPWYPRQARETSNLIVNYLDGECFNRKK
ncbi:MAG: S9 family peptidase [Xanthomonadales bacterium PRO7]|jgi:dipeptidyl aminopeptidase/acylaminoacyl peptidase|nr:S9 family peptidase [Xanthomonadales bacterium PRO7]HMM58060.1 prolyl oligopeptidase family serine peptidase [Rudaea sp.]